MASISYDFMEKIKTTLNPDELNVAYFDDYRPLPFVVELIWFDKINYNDEVINLNDRFTMHFGIYDNFTDLQLTRLIVDVEGHFNELR